MQKFKVSLPHGLSQEEALNRIKSLLPELQAQYDDPNKLRSVRQKWEGNTAEFSFVAWGFFIAGSMSVGASEIELDLELPTVAMRFKDRIEEAIRQRAAAVLG